MGLSLKIENMTQMPDGGPLGIDVLGKRGIDIGRDQHLDWTLPDPTRFISGKHCEIRFKDDAYWLHDLSTNGTFLNGAEERMRSPHRLRTGDRLEIGDYIVAVTVDSEPPVAVKPGKNERQAPHEDLWHIAGEVAAPIPIEPLRPSRRSVPGPADFLDRLVDTSGPAKDALWNNAGRSLPRADISDLDWSEGAPPRRSDFAARAPAELDRHRVDPESVKSPPTPTRESRLPSAIEPPVNAFLPRSEPPAPAAQDERPAELSQAETGLDAPLTDFVKRVAAGAGVHETVFARYTPAELAEILGLLLRTTASNLLQLLSARSELKDVVRSSSHTTIVKTNNNPLKFSPGVEEAIRMMFALSSSSYLDAPRAFEQSFSDLKKHQGQIFAAMQDAIRSIQRDLDPKNIDAEVEVDRGIGSMVASRKTKLWDAYVTRWRMTTERHENGLLGVFLDYFAAAYDRAGTSDQRH